MISVGDMVDFLQELLSGEEDIIDVKAGESELVVEVHHTAEDVEGDPIPDRPVIYVIHIRTL